MTPAEMTPAEIEQHGRSVRRKLTRLYEDSPYKNYKPISDLFSVADDLSELVIALAQEVKRLSDLVHRLSSTTESKTENDNGNEQ